MSHLIKPPLGTLPIIGHPLAQGLVGCWLMNEGGGDTIYDLSGNGNAGTINNSVVWADGRFGRCLDFAGTEVDKVTMPDNPAYSGLDQISVVFWMYPHVLSTISRYKMIVGKANWAEEREWRFRFESGDFFTWHVSNDGNDPGANECNVSTSLLTLSAWNHIVGVYDGTNLWLYINGVQVDTHAGDLGGIHDGTAVMAIGASSDLGGKEGDAYDGLIDHVVIYNRPLSSGEVAKLYRDPFCMFRRTPIELWTGATSGGITPTEQNAIFFGCNF